MRRSKRVCTYMFTFVYKPDKVWKEVPVKLILTYTYLHTLQLPSKNYKNIMSKRIKSCRNQNIFFHETVTFYRLDDWIVFGKSKIMESKVNFAIMYATHQWFAITKRLWVRSKFQILGTFAHAPLAVFSVTYHKTPLNSFTYHYLFSCAAKRKGLIESRLMFSCQPCTHLRGVGKIRHLESEFKNVRTFSRVKWISLVILLLNGFIFVHHAISYPLFEPVALMETLCASF